MSSFAESFIKTVVDQSQLKNGSFYAIEGLEPGTAYSFSAQALTLAGPSHSESVAVSATTDSAGLTGGVIAAIVIACLVVLVILVFGFVSAIR